jgi:hypothetical protein
MRGSFIFLDNNKKNKKKTIRVWHTLGGEKTYMHGDYSSVLFIKTVK